MGDVGAHFTYFDYMVPISSNLDWISDIIVEMVLSNVTLVELLLNKTFGFVTAFKLCTSYHNHTYVLTLYIVLVWSGSYKSDLCAGSWREKPSVKSRGG